MDLTPNLKLPFIAPAQAQKHVTHNEALLALDAVVQASVKARLNTPPEEAADGARWIVEAAAVGDWAGQEARLAARQDGAWTFYTPLAGWLAWVEAEARLVVFDGAAWIAVHPAPTLLGVNTSADVVSRFAVASAASLFTHEGAGHQLKINKALASETGALLFQTGYSGRAEIGLMGDDQLRFKVSPDGATWREAMVVDPVTGAVAFPHTTISGGGGGSGSLASTTFAARPTAIGATELLLISDERLGASVCYSDGTRWMRVLDDRPAQSGVVNYYVDSVAGNDSNSGTSSAAPIRTIAQLAALIAAAPAHLRSGLRIAFKRGSTWRERFAGDANMAGVRLEAYGALSDAAPLFDAADVLVNANFTKTAGQTNVYQITHAVETDTLAAEWPGMWVDGVRLAWAASLAACDSKPGTFYVPATADVASLTLYVHPPGSSNPASDGKVYEATKRKSGVDLYACPYAEVEGVHARRNHASYGSITLGRHGRAIGCRTSDGNTHNLFVRAYCEVVDHVADGWHSNGQAATTYIAYDTNTDGIGADAWVKFTRCAARQTTQLRVPPTAIIGVTQANPAVVTAPAHGLANNDYVVLTGVAGMTEINGRTFIIAGATTDTFQLKTMDLDTGVSSNLNSTAFGAYTSGGTAALADFCDNPTSGNAIGFYAHTDAALMWDRVEYEGCEAYGCAMPFNAGNCRTLVMTNISARQFYIGIGALADRVVIRGLQGNVAFLNRPAIIGATLLRSDLAHQSIELDGVSAVLNATGNIYLSQAGVKLTARRGTFTGFNTLVRCTGANQVVDIKEVTHIDNGKSSSGYSNYDINSTAAASLKLSSDYNSFGGGTRSFLFNGATLTLDQWRAATAQDWRSKA